MSDRFEGTETVLRKCVAATSVKGSWRDLNGYIQFRAYDGAILNWWPKTKTISFQGNVSSACELKEKLKNLSGELWIGSKK